MPRTTGPRPLQLTLPFHTVLLTTLALDVRAVVFWLRVGGSPGVSMAVTAAGIAVLVLALLTADLARQVLLRSNSRHGNLPDDPTP